MLVMKKRAGPTKRKNNYKCWLVRKNVHQQVKKILLFVGKEKFIDTNIFFFCLFLLVCV